MPGSMHTTVNEAKSHAVTRQSFIGSHSHVSIYSPDQGCLPLNVRTADHKVVFLPITMLTGMQSMPNTNCTGVVCKYQIII